MFDINFAVSSRQEGMCTLCEQEWCGLNGDCVRQTYTVGCIMHIQRIRTVDKEGGTPNGHDVRTWERV